MTRHGYACLVVDVRGTGASTGSRGMEFSSEEVADGATVVDWILSQAWSNGKVGCTGISYLGTTAELLLVNKHPAVRAAILRSSVYDLYQHMVFPGGMRQGPFIEVWRNTTYALDNNEMEFFGVAAGLLVRGVKPVDDDKRRRQLLGAYGDHKANFDIFKPLRYMTFRDEIVPELGKSIDDFSPHRHTSEIVASNTPIYRISGWYDGALAKGAIQAFLKTANSQKLLIGPWDHGPFEYVSPYGKHSKVSFDVYAEMLRFFDFYLKDIENGIMDDPPIHYYNMGHEEWRSADQWPLRNAEWQTFYMKPDFTIAPSKIEQVAEPLKFPLNYTFSSGGGSRWNSLTPVYRYEKIGYSDWDKRAQSLVVFSSEMLEKDWEITGHPVMHLTLQATTSDATIFVYLQDRGPDGKVTYITEGQFRAIHRKEVYDASLSPVFGATHSFSKQDASPMKSGEVYEMNFDLLPVSYLMKAGHRLEIAFAGLDTAHFDGIDQAPQEWILPMSPLQNSAIEIPLVKSMP